jgi:hypothetical protein
MSGEAVVRQIVDGRLGLGRAVELGLVRPYGGESGLARFGSLTDGGTQQ